MMRHHGADKSMTEEPKHQCPECGGHGRIITFDGIVLGECQMCRGFKTIPEHQLEWIAAGKALKEQRIAKRITLRDMAKHLGVDVCDLSRMERGAIQAPPNLANEYANACLQSSAG